MNTATIQYKVTITVAGQSQTVTVNHIPDAPQWILKRQAIEQWVGDLPQGFISFTWKAIEPDQAPTAPAFSWKRYEQQERIDAVSTEAPAWHTGSPYEY